MIKTKVYEINRCVNMGTEDVYGEMLKNNDNAFYHASRVKDNKEALRQYEYKKKLIQDIKIHKSLYPWYSGYAWNDGEQEPVGRESLSIPFRHKSYVIAMRGE
jgi:hypothetical protein